MAFTVEDLQDLIRLIDLHPEMAGGAASPCADRSAAGATAARELVDAQARTEARFVELVMPRRAPKQGPTPVIWEEKPIAEICADSVSGPTGSGL